MCVSRVVPKNAENADENLKTSHTKAHSQREVVVKTSARLAAADSHDQLMKTCWRTAVLRWDRTHRSTSKCAGRFGERAYWEQAYASRRAPDEWFLSAEVAAQSTLEAFASHARRYHNVPQSIAAINLGCGTSCLGTRLSQSIASRTRLPTLVEVVI